MTETIPVPVWVMLLLVVLMVAWQWAAAKQSEALRDLFRIYWRAQYGEELSDPAREGEVSKIDAVLNPKD